MRIRKIPTGRQRKRKRVRVLFRGTMIAALAGLVLMTVVVAYFSWKLPKLNSLQDYEPALPSIVYDRDNNEITRFYTENREIVSVDQVPRMVIDALLAIEDSNYYQHKGLDYVGIFRAFLKNVYARKVVQGGSTITQQVAKSLLLSRERTYTRKIKEAILARRMNKRFTKDEVLEIYLNQIYFGYGSYGIETASENYFNKHVWELELHEAALLAGLPKAPSKYSPTRNPEESLERRNLVLLRMTEEGFITPQEEAEAASKPLDIDPRKKPDDDPVDYFAEHIRRYVYDKYGEDQLYRGGLKIYSTLDMKLQKAAVEAVGHGLLALDKRQGYRGPVEFVSSEGFPDALERIKAENGLADSAYTVTDEVPWTTGQVLKALVIRVDRDGAEIDLGGVSGYLPTEELKWARRPRHDVEYTADVVKDARRALSVGSMIRVRYLNKKNDEKGGLFALEQEPVVEGALVSLDAPTGQILALVGGYDYKRSEFNRATQARRQPGSAFKPVVYSAAMDNGFTPSSIIIDSPIIYDDPAEELKWKPANYEEKFYGPTTLRTGITKSRNVVTIKLVQKLGLQTVIQYAKRFGFERDLPEDLSLSLGSLGVTPVELTSAYSVFANLGLRATPWAVKKIQDRKGEVLEQGGPELVRSLSEDTAYIMQNLLRGVVKFGTGWRAKALGRPSGGKTGTTNDMIDAWYMGFTPQIVTGVWVGFDEEASLGVNETGSRAAAPIWLEYMKKALDGKPALPFPPPPPGVEMVKVEPKSGLLSVPGSSRFIYETFKIGTGPRQYAKAPLRKDGTTRRTYTPGYIPPSDLPGILPRDF